MAAATRGVNCGTNARVNTFDNRGMQAQQQNHSLLHELRWLVSHGLLHLLGWDHPTAEKLNEMIGCQEQLLGVEGNLEKIGKKNVQLDETSRKT